MTVTVSFLGLMAGGLCNLIAVILLAKSYKRLRRVELLAIILLFSIAFSAHSMSHAYQESAFNWNPISKFFPIPSMNAFSQVN